MSPELSHDQLQDLLGVYALDATSDQERRAIEAHLDTCPRCRAEVAEHLETAAMLASMGATAPEGVWNAISERLDRPGDVVVHLEEARSERVSGRQPWRWVTGAVAAAAVAAAVSLGVAVAEQDRRIEQLATDVERAGIARLAAAAVLHPDARRVTLASEDGSELGEAVILPNGRGYLVQDSLRPLSPGRTYQLWALGGEAPISAGVLGTDPRIVAFTIDPRATTGLAISEERSGGAVAPGAPLAAGDVEAM